MQRPWTWISKEVGFLESLVESRREGRGGEEEEKKTWVVVIVFEVLS